MCLRTSTHHHDIQGWVRCTFLSKRKNSAQKTRKKWEREEKTTSHHNEIRWTLQLILIYFFRSSSTEPFPQQFRASPKSLKMFFFADILLFFPSFSALLCIVWCDVVDRREFLLSFATLFPVLDSLRRIYRMYTRERCELHARNDDVACSVEFLLEEERKNSEFFRFSSKAMRLLQNFSFVSNNTHIGSRAAAATFLEWQESEIFSVRWFAYSSTLTFLFIIFHCSPSWKFFMWSMQSWY